MIDCGARQLYHLLHRANLHTKPRRGYWQLNSRHPRLVKISMPLLPNSPIPREYPSAGLRECDVNSCCCGFRGINPLFFDEKLQPGSKQFRQAVIERVNGGLFDGLCK